MEVNNTSRSNNAANAARCFRQAATLISNTELLSLPKREPLMVIPFVVNASFACELYLKALAYRSDVGLTGHSLSKLLANLPQGERQNLDRAWASLNNQVIHSVASMELVIHALSNCFESWRYSYEKERVTAPDSSSIFDLLEALDIAYWY